jgi:hypothetical protein
MSGFVYADMKVRIHQTQQRRGLIRVYAFTRLARHVRAMCTGVVHRACVVLRIMRECVSVYPRIYSSVARVAWIRACVNAYIGLFFFKRRKAKGMGRMIEVESGVAGVVFVAHPPAGTPGAVHLGGNSTPARALVAGLGKSERCGEPKGAK